MGGAAGRPRVLAVGDRPCRERLPYRDVYKRQVDIKELDLGDQGAGLLDGLLDLAAGNGLVADQCQVCLLYTSRCV